MVSEDHSGKQATVEGYDILAENNDAVEISPWGDSQYQQYYVWPAAQAVLPQVGGTRVLDAGCGTGEHVGWFLDHGAEVVGVDASGEALETARDRFGGRATFHRADLTEPLEFASEDRFDLIFCNLVLDHIENWDPVFEEFRRVLTADGDLVITTIHPMRRYSQHTDELTSYYETEAYVVNWADTGARIAQYHRRISEILDSFIEARLNVVAFREITPCPGYEEHNPERYEKAMKEPDTLCIRGQPAGSGAN